MTPRSQSQSQCLQIYSRERFHALREFTGATRDRRGMTTEKFAERYR